MNEELKVIISAETDKLKKNVDGAKKEVKSFSDKVKEASKDVDDKFSSMGASIKNAMKVGAVAMAGAATAILALGASTAEYRQEQAKLLTAFEAAGAGAQEAKETYNDLYRVLGDTGQATEAASHLAKLTTGEKELSEWTNICQGVYATFGASLPIESLTEAANETAKVGTLTGGLADALNWAGVNEEEFQAKLDACNTEAEREALIRQTLNGLYSDAAAKYEENNAQILAQNEAQTKMNDALAALGEAVAPINTMLTELGAEVLAALTPYIQAFAENYLPTIRDALGEVGEKLKVAFEWMSEHKTLLGVLAGIIGGIVTAIGLYNAVSAIKTAMAAAEVATVWGLVAAYAAQAAAMVVALAPYLLIVAAIAAVIAIIVLCVKHWDSITAAVKNFADKAVAWIKNAVDKIVAFFKKIIDWVVENWQGLLLLIVNPFAGAFKLLYDNCDGFREFIDNLLKKIGEFFKNLWKDIQNTFKAVGNWFSNIFTDAWNGIKNAFSAVGSFFRGIWNDIKSIFSNVGTAIANAITGTVKKAVNSVLSTAVKIINGFIKAINVAIDIINAIPAVNIKKLNMLNVPQLAKGGIINSATLAVVGEQGKEAVMPLENNTEWMDKLADRIANRNGNTPIVLQVDGKTFAQISVDSINDLTRQRGSLPLVFA